VPEGQFEGRVALVTGAASGIGRASAVAFAREGASVVVGDVDVSGGEETARLIESSDGRAIFVKTDVSQSSDVEALVKAAIDTYGRLDYAHNNAGILGPQGVTAECAEETFDRVIAINLKGIFLCMRNELPHMVVQGKGAIVNTCSTSGVVASYGLPAYTASKHGVAGLTKTAAVEYIRSGIRINAVCPGFIDTPLTQALGGKAEGPKVVVPIARLGTPEEVAEAVVWLCSDAASYVTGSLLMVDGALTTL
jgi:NAD(P)-dependent dehydrogenase (short-subunit alcohol dehydrogenase family)